MRAALLHTYGESPVVEDIDVPVREPGRSLVRVDAAALGHLDLTVASGTFGVKPTLPHIGGTDGSGTVVESDTLPIGSRVLVRGKGIGLFKNGCWADYVVVDDRALTPVNAELDPAVAATFFLPSTTGYVSVNDVARVAPGERVVVSGASGAVGAMAAQFALLAGAAEVIGVVPREDQVELVPAGVRPVVGRGDTLLEALGSEPVADVLIDTLGGDVLAPLLRAVVPGGRAALIGYTLGTELTVDLPNWLLSDVSLLPVNMMRKTDRQAELAPVMIDRLLSGDLVLTVQRFDLEDIADALIALREGKVAGRAVVVPGLRNR
ncbi:zinc-binding alcohol dehydrogenase family protein [Rhodococcus sp. Eu-32]|uniref:quinone oxidoreductase family protein n=1 Tax=Rhodococcus sp. Eu-32 TaxID=1017319 RepID=UPI000DF38889|nr:zinc-binding dehydrogenase [Rhodococcus sp. Eu-32]RRQ27021.1 zinc-binding alcohol dehydrogenase family protein [Rhodococcus sp. Eu-32]